MSVHFLLDEDAARLVDKGPASPEGKAAADDFQRALDELRDMELAAAVSSFRLASGKNPAEFKFTYYVVACSCQAGLHPDTYLRDIESYEQRGGDHRASTALRAMELCQRGNLAEAINYLRGSYDLIDVMSAVREAGVSVLRMIFLALDKRDDLEFAYSILFSLNGLTYPNPEFFKSLSAAIGSVKLESCDIASAVLRHLYAHMRADCARFIANHQHLRWSRAFCRELASIPEEGRSTEIETEVAAFLALPAQDRPAKSFRESISQELLEIRESVLTATPRADEGSASTDILFLRSCGPLQSGKRNAVCFFGQLRDVEAFQTLKSRLASLLDADVFVSTWNSVGNYRLDPHGSFYFLSQIIPDDLKPQFDDLKIENFNDLKRRFPEFYDLITSDVSVPMDASLLGLSNDDFKLYSLHDPVAFLESAIRLTLGAAEKAPLHVQNQIRMWYLIDGVLALRREAEEARGTVYDRVLLVRSDLVIPLHSLENLKTIVETMKPGEIASDFDLGAWTVGGIGDRFFAASGRDIDVLRVPWRHAPNLFHKSAQGGGKFLEDLAPHRLARDVPFAAGLAYRPVFHHVVEYQISRKITHFETELRKVFGRMREPKAKLSWLGRVKAYWCWY